MSGASYRSYGSTLGGTKELFSSDAKKAKKAAEERKERLGVSRATVETKKIRESRVVEEIFDRSLAKNTITSPKKGVKRLHILLVDNSGSNHRIASHLRASSGYLAAMLNAIDPESQVAFMYFSDHCDGPHIWQEVDYVTPDEEGDKVLLASIANIVPAGGGDAPEAIECALWEICKKDFGDAEEKHLYLITDVVAHGMGMRGDDGCPEQRDWKKSVKKVKEIFTTFTVIGSGEDDEDAELQKQFLDPDRVKYDLIDLSNIKETWHRQAITGNAFLFLVARNTGKQAVELFLCMLYEKWLQDPVFGKDTDQLAKEAIRRFGKYLEQEKDEIDKLMAKVLAE